MVVAEMRSTCGSGDVDVRTEHGAHPGIRDGAKATSLRILADARSQFGNDHKARATVDAPFGMLPRVALREPLARGLAILPAERRNVPALHRNGRAGGRRCCSGAPRTPSPRLDAGLKVSTEKIPESQVLMTIEVEPERLDEAREKAVRRLAPRAKVPGFRPGKAPTAMVRRYFGEERILDEALDVLVPVVYREAVQADESIDPIARPRLVVETTDPLVVKATIPVRPTVDAGDYKAVRVKAEEVTVDEERVEQTLQILRKRSSTLEPVERALAWNDVARINIQATVEGETLVKQQDAEVQLIEDRDVLFPGFEEQLIGHAKGETIEFTLPVPEAIKEEKFAGK
ncbi:MAG: trigger factor, partial [Dehalococcoidia bacterium]